MGKQFDEKDINELYENLTKRIRSGERLELIDQNLGIVSGHALDALEMARDIGHPLDLFELSDEKVNTITIAMYLFFSKKGYSSTKCRETVAKKLGGYLFFTVCNVCNNTANAAPAARGSGLYIEVQKDDGESSLIDVFMPVENHIKRNLKYDADAETVIIADPEGILRDIRGQIENRD